MKKETKAQAALEFLTTYGWAFLVILVMISALAYFGILKPSRLLPDRCNFGTELECQDYMIDATANTLTIRLKNNIGEAVQIQDAADIAVSSESATPVTCALAGITDSGGAQPLPAAGSPYTWDGGSVVDFDLDTCTYSVAGIVTGDKGKVDITITYNKVKSGGTYEHDVIGEIYSTVK